MSRRVEPGFYRHFKGATYCVHGVAVLTNVTYGRGIFDVGTVTMEGGGERRLLMQVYGRNVLHLIFALDHRERGVFVIYSNKAGQRFARSIESWFTQVEVGGQWRPRFEQLKPQEP